MVFAAVCACAQIKIACIGDSITYGAGIVNRDNTYPAILGRMLGDKYEVKNFGVSGATLLLKGDKPYINQPAYKDALDFAPDIVIIKLGTNDSKPQNWKYWTEFEHDLNALIDSFESLSTHPRVYLCRPVQAFDVKWGINENVIQNECFPIIKKVAAAQELEIIDLYEPLKNKSNLFPDAIHPNSAGAYIMASSVYKTLTGKTAKPLPNPIVFEPKRWNNFTVSEFEYGGRKITVASPGLPADGNLWVWRPAFFGAFAQVDVALLSKGYYIVCIDFTNDYGNPDAVAEGKVVFDYLTRRYGLSKKVVLEGLSRGGLYALNWAKAYPQNVACLYLDAPVCDLGVWPKNADAKLYNDMLAKWKLQNLDGFKHNGFDDLEALAKAKVPVFLVAGGADEIVPFATNGKILAERYKALGGEIEVVLKPDCGHHPHSLENPAPIVDFILNSSK